MRGVDVPPDKQGLLFFTCRNYINLSEDVRRRIDELCWKISKGDESYRAALFDLLTTHESVTSISMRHCVGQTTIYRLRKEFYEEWYRKGPA